MKTALLFPGLDALLVASKMKRWTEVPAVSGTLSEASRILARLTGEDEGLRSLIHRSSRPHLEDFDRASVALTAIQIGIARALEEASECWDLVVGCSHGDIARSVVCGVLSLADAVEIVWTFAALRKDCPDGKTANVRTIDGAPLLETHLDWLRSEGAPPSLWSTHHATVAAIAETIDRLAGMSREHGLKIKPVFPFAVHSAAMNGLAKRFAELAPKWAVREPRWPVFSSVYVRPLLDVEELRTEAIAGAVCPIPWTRTIERLREGEGVERFLNVGPSNALTGWMLGSPKLAGARVQDAWDLLNPLAE